MATLDAPVLPPFLYRYRELASEEEKLCDPGRADKIFTRELGAIKNRLLHFTNYKGMNDPMEGFYDPSRRAKNDPNFASTASEIYHAKINFGLCCFSDTHDNELMWAHYSNNYAGICVGYRPQLFMTSLSPDFHLVRMAYGNDPPVLSVHDLVDHNGAARKILSHKKATWVYEREWRLAGPVGDHYVKSKLCIRELYLGLRIRPQYKTRLLTELKNVSIKIFEMSPLSNYEHEWVKIKRLK
jgi:hypothetical protein